MTTRTKLSGAMAAAATLLLALAGCSGGKGSSLSLSARATAETAAPAPAAAAGLQVDDHVTLTRIRFVVRDVKLESHLATAGTATAAATDDKGGTRDDGTSDDSDEIEVHAGPVLVDLQGDALTAAKIEQQLAVTVPDGTYDELKLKIHKLEDLEKTGDADVDAARASIILDGTFDGAPFRFVSQLSAQQKFEGSFTVGGATPANITLHLDATGWFKAADGSALDPSVAANRPFIEQNVKGSLRAFEDDDHDGHDDRGGDAGGHGLDDGPNHT